MTLVSETGILLSPDALGRGMSFETTSLKTGR